MVLRTLPVLGLLAASLPAAALPFNPIDPALSLTVHAQASCYNGVIDEPAGTNTLSLDSFPGDLTVGCTGGAVRSNSTTLDSVASEGQASADLTAGTLKARAVGRAFSGANGSLAIGSSETARLYDTLTVNGTWTGIKLIGITMTVHGTMTSNAVNPNWQIGSQAFSTALLAYDPTGALLGAAGLPLTMGNNGIPFLGGAITQINATVTTNVPNNGVVFDPNDVQVTMTYQFPATVSNRTFSFLARLNVGSAMGFGTGLPLAVGDVNFGNTARLALTVPAGVTVTSESGAFLTAPDADADGIADADDNCRLVANAGQCDSDGDGYGNRCDGDLNNNAFTNAQDATLFRQQLGLPSTGPVFNKADINCNGAVNAQDATLFRSLLGAPPGPSGLVP